MSDKEKMELAATGAAKIEGAHRRAVGEFLNPEEPLANVVGVASGVKWRGGEPTGEPAVLVLVSHKIGKDELPKEDLVPVKVGEVKTDVLEIGFPIAQQLRHAPPMGPGHVPRPRQFARPAVEGDGALVPMLEEEEYVALAEALMLARRVRPAEGGYSVGHYQITAGTIATCVYDILPGPYDGGTDPTDRIAALSRWVPITLEPPTPRSLHRNVVDAAIAQGQFHDLDREIYWIGYARGWRRKANIGVGTIVQKTGRTANYTTGRITAINATVDVGYGGGRVARFFDQIVTTNISAGGDSGSLVLTLDNVAVGLLFAGSSVATIVNQIENVRSLLRVEVAQQVL